MSLTRNDTYHRGSGLPNRNDISYSSASTNAARAATEGHKIFVFKFDMPNLNSAVTSSVSVVGAHRFPLGGARVIPLGLAPWVMFYRVSCLVAAVLGSLVESAVFGDAAAGAAVPAWLAAAGEVDVDGVGAPEPPAALQQAVGVVGAWPWQAGNDIRGRVHFFGAPAVAAGGAGVVPGRLFGL